MPAGDRLAVWGAPIDHSKSPALHAAAYRVLGEPWDYGRRRVEEFEFLAVLEGLDASWRGLSLTFPLKSVAHRVARQLVGPAQLTGAVNTFLLTDDGPHGFNTDVGGLAADLRTQGIDGLDAARIVGAGSTATSALLALGEVGVGYVEVVARRPHAVAALEDLGDRLGIDVHPVPLTAGAHGPLPLTIAALPGGASVPEEAGEALSASGGLLYDVVYGQWPTSLAAHWQSAGHRAVHGLGMLVQQALLQVRIFAHGDPSVPLAREPEVLAAMHAALDDGGGDGGRSVVGD